MVRERPAKEKRERGDREILDAASRGEPSAAADLYRRFAGTVHGIVLSRVGAQDAEDLTQEVFVAVYRRLGTVREVGALGAWICRIARNTAIDHLRRKRRRPAHEPLQDVADDTSAGDLESRAHRAMALVRALPEAYRETMVLRLVEGLTGPEIAERTGKTHGSVRVNLCRGMALLRPLLRNEGLL